jgi:MYXO-CTERM domain-containing protein
MTSKVRLLAIAGLFALSCGQVDGPGQTSQGLSGPYHPAPHFATTCDCMPINGTCDDNACTITCNSGFGDCNNKVNDGCETALNTIFDCGSCGADCSCFGNATCTNGKCGGKALSDGTACNAPQPCSSIGVCESSICLCSDKVDMAGGQSVADLSVGGGGGQDMSGNGGNTPGGCSVGGNAAPHAGWLVLGLLGFALVLRRKNS